MNAIDRVVAALTAADSDPRPYGDRWQARCPAHDDQNPSLSVRESDDKVLLHCHAGCQPDAIVSALGLAMVDLFAEPPSSNGAKKRTIAATYPYRDEAGRLLFEVVRFSPKGFAQRRRDSHGQWVWNLDGVRRVLYRLPAVICAVEEARPVWLVEGEKDAEALTAAGVCGTCNPHGAGKWRPEFAEVLTGADVTVVADRDEPGRAHATHVATSLASVARTVRVVEPTHGKDAADHLAAGLSLADFTPMTAPTVVDLRPGTPQVVAASTITTRRVRWAWRDRLVIGGFNLAAGRPKEGKTVFMLHLAAKATRGELEGELWGQPVNVLFLSTEDASSFTLVPRAIAAGADLERLFVLSDPAALAPDVIRAHVERTGARFVILDPIVTYLGGPIDDHKNLQIRQALAPLAQLAHELDVALTGISHFTTKTAGKDLLGAVLGSTGYTAAARSILGFGRGDTAEGEQVRMMATIGNLGQEVPNLLFKLENVEVPTGDGPSNVPRIVELGEAATSDPSAIFDSADDKSEREAARELILDALDGVQLPARQLDAVRKRECVSDATWRRARDELKKRGVIDRRKGGMKEGWFWFRTPEDAHETPNLLREKRWASSGAGEQLRASDEEVVWTYQRS